MTFPPLAKCRNRLQLTLRAIKIGSIYIYYDVLELFNRHLIVMIIVMFRGRQRVSTCFRGCFSTSDVY